MKWCIMFASAYCVYMSVAAHLSHSQRSVKNGSDRRTAFGIHSATRMRAPVYSQSVGNEFCSGSWCPVAFSTTQNFNSHHSGMRACMRASSGCVCVHAYAYVCSLGLMQECECVRVRVRVSGG